MSTVIDDQTREFVTDAGQAMIRARELFADAIDAKNGGFWTPTMYMDNVAGRKALIFDLEHVSGSVHHFSRRQVVITDLNSSVAKLPWAYLVNCPGFQGTTLIANSQLGAHVTNLSDAVTLWNTNTGNFLDDLVNLTGLTNTANTTDTGDFDSGSIHWYNLWRIWSDPPQTVINFENVLLLDSPGDGLTGIDTARIRTPLIGAGSVSVPNLSALVQAITDIAKRDVAMAINHNGPYFHVHAGEVEE